MIAAGLIIAALAVIAVLALMLKRAKELVAEAEAEARNAQGQADFYELKATALERQVGIERAEIERLTKLAERTEEINAERNEQRDKVTTGDPAADFAGSLDVLSDLSTRRRTAP